jgi:hypothetical protein
MLGMNESREETLLVSRIAIALDWSTGQVKRTPFTQIMEKLVDVLESQETLLHMQDETIKEQTEVVRTLRNQLKIKDSVIESVDKFLNQFVR